MFESVMTIKPAGWVSPCETHPARNCLLTNKAARKSLHARRGGHAEVIIGRAFARPVGFAHLQTGRGDRFSQLPAAAENLTAARFS